MSDWNARHGKWIAYTDIEAVHEGRLNPPAAGRNLGIGDRQLKPILALPVRSNALAEGNLGCRQSLRREG